MREFIAPLPLAAVALLAVNDHLLKATFHNALTGKLSDIAGCFFLPLYVSALLSVVPLSVRARLGIGAAVTTVLFASVKVSRVAADWVCRQIELLSTPLGYPHLWIATDLTDLVCLPLVALAVAYGLSRSRECTASLQSV